ncbi:MAG: FG-GAP repeat protein [Deltaproteobacteria bacterium]|nr:FG-GAP repeat protein [Deltaproteobacteria bacterium]
MRPPTLLLPLLLTLVAAGCTGTTPDDDGGTDADADGHTADVDCDDNDSRVHPGADEVCDGVDNDCDGAVDPGLTISAFTDGDGDGFGAAGSAVEVCGLGAGLVDNDADCDDSSAAAAPGLTEVCDGLDNDCDAIIDNGLTSPFWPDADGDGFGDSAAAVVEACDPGPGFADNNLDCNDLTDVSNPGAVEVCDAEDNNCDGVVDEGLTATWHIDADADGFGDPATASVTCAPAPEAVLDGTDCNDADVLINPAVLEVCGGADEDCNGLIDDVDSDGDGQAPLGCAAGTDCDDARADAYAGAPELWYDGVDQDCLGGNDYDADLDGFDSDLHGGLDCDDSSALARPGEVEVCGDGYDNDCDGTVGTCGMSGDYLAADADLTMLGEAAGDTAAQGDPGVAGVGDLNGDGIADIAVSAMRNDNIAVDAGAVYILLGATGHGGVESLALADAKLTGEAANDFAGRSLAGGDLDGDGFDDLVLSAQNESTAGANAGAAYIIPGPISGGGSVGLGGLAIARLTGAAADDLLADVSVAGDVNGDGVDDLLLGAQFADSGAFANNGAAYLFFGPVSGDLSVSVADATLRGAAGAVEAGSALAGAGDLNGDGFADLLIGSRNSSRGAANGGAVNVVLGPVSGEVDLGLSAAIYTAIGAGDDLGGGASVTSAGDMDGDGYPEIAFGARNNDAAGTNAGAVYIVRGPVPAGVWSASAADAILLGQAARDLTGDSVAGAGDVDGDGLDDLLIGSGYNDAGAADAGAAYLIAGWTAGTRNLTVAAGARFLPGAAGDRVRTKGAGDFNDDGYNDILMGAQNNSTVGATAGAAYLFYGEGL